MFNFQWKEGDEIPESWQDYYKYNPCVPVDYQSINSAFSVINTPRSARVRSIRVLLRPGRYVLREPINVDTPYAMRVALETMEMPEFCCLVDETTTEAEPVSRRKKTGKIRKYLNCRTVEVEENDEDPLPEVLDPLPREAATLNNKRATLTLRSSRQNEPIIRVSHGYFTLRNMELRHYSKGLGESVGVYLCCLHIPI